MTNPSLRPAEIDALANALAASGTVRIGLDQLWELWAAAAPRLVGVTAQAAALAAALQDLEHQGVVQLPRHAWDTSTVPPLPRSLIVPGARTASKVRRWVSYPWCGELGWVSSLPFLSDACFDDLVAVNDWLARNRGREVPIMPLRYRSVDVFGNEKRLEGIVRTNLFGLGRLTLEMLSCVRIPAPLPAIAVGPGEDVLVVENSDTYWVAIDAIHRAPEHRIGSIAWGSGKSFPSQVSALGVDVAGRGPVTGTVWYWGDLDPTGVAIGANAAAAAEFEGAPKIRPAVDLWAAMADRPIQDVGGCDWSTTNVRDWLGPPLWNRFEAVRAAHGRVAQESVLPAVISQWAASLSMG